MTELLVGRRGTGTNRVRIAVIAGAVALALIPGWSASADTAPVAPVTVSTVSADVLPTAQMNGVVWDQVIVGDTVYATGSFTSARPAGSAAGTNETPRANLLAYRLSTGALLPWAPTLNAEGKAIVASTDGSTIFVGGSFTSVSGVTRNRVVALNAVTGAVLTTFTTGANARVRSLTVSGSTLFIGGIFSTVGGQARTRLAAVSTTNGAVLPWAPVANAEVLALVAPAGSGRVVVAGKFTTLNGVAAYGMGAVNATTGATGAWAINSVVRDAGDDAAIYSLSTDGAQVYGTGYSYGPGGNFEGTFAARSSDGQLVYVTGCRGDTYDAKPIGSALYYVSHTHDCSSVGGNPQTNPWGYARASAQTTTRAASGANNVGGTFNGRPAPELLHWQPTFQIGSYTGGNQAAWTVEVTSNYVTLGGEFLSVNGVAQQGLVRFAISSIAPNKEKPQGGTQLLPTLTGAGPGAMKISWQAAWDRDNRRLSYDVMRGSTLASSVVIATLTADTAWWKRPTMSFTDTTVPPGSTQTYRIKARDAFGNFSQGNPTTGTVPAAKAAKRAKAAKAAKAVEPESKSLTPDRVTPEAVAPNRAVTPSVGPSPSASEASPSPSVGG